MEKQEKDRFPFNIDPRVVASPLTCHDSRELLAMKKRFPHIKLLHMEKDTDTILVITKCSTASYMRYESKS